MNVFLWILVGIAILFFLLYLLFFRIFTYKISIDNGKVKVKISSMTIVDTSVVKATKVTKKKTEKVAEKTVEEPRDVLKILNSVKEFITANSVYIKETLQILLKIVRTIKFDVYMKFSAGNPAHTGIATGSIWALLSAVVGILDEYTSIRNIANVDIVPQYTSKFFDYKFEFWAKLNFNNAINFTIHILKLIMMYKKYDKEN